MRLIVAGSRDLTDYGLVSKVLNRLNTPREDLEILSGGARGADKLGERWARENDVTLKVFPADWDGLGKRAGYVRNEVMATHGQGLLAFWDGKSRGTKHMIDIANKAGLIVHVVAIGGSK